MSENKMKQPDGTAPAQGSGDAARKGIGYTVRRGDTLSGIARLYGVSVLDLVSWNDIRNPELVRAGQTLVIYQN